MTSLRKQLQNPKMKRDIEHAFEHYRESFGEIGTCEASTRKMSLDDISDWDDFSSWVEFDRGELKELPEDEARQALMRYRGSEWGHRAEKWLANGKIPPIVLVHGKLATCVGDGRGRVNIAVGLDISPLDVIILISLKRTLS